MARVSPGIQHMSPLWKLLMCTALVPINDVEDSSQSQPESLEKRTERGGRLVPLFECTLFDYKHDTCTNRKLMGGVGYSAILHQLLMLSPPGHLWWPKKSQDMDRALKPLGSSSQYNHYRLGKREPL
jgi:hypothetical protein